MSSRPSSSLRAQLTSPPPSKALLDLQRQGLELVVSPPPGFLVAPRPVSGRSTPSDLDKPLPLEPFEAKKRRSSSVYSFDRGSVYSTDTTITNILRMYSGYQDLDDVPPIPPLHQPQAYRDTVAPLLIKRLSLSQSSSPHPVLKDAPREARSISSLRSAASHGHAVPSNKDAPSFAEFSRALHERRTMMVSPLSSSSEIHRQDAYNQLAMPSPQVSSVELSISVSHTPPLPDAMSVSISDADESELLPSPLDMSSSSLPHNDWEKPLEFKPSYEDGQPQQPSHHRSWSHNWLEDNFVSQSPEASPTDMHEDHNFFPMEEIERERVISYAEAKYPGMKRKTSSAKNTKNNSARSSVQQGVGNLLQSLSRKSAKDPKEWPEHNSRPPRERQLAIPATPYQVYGTDVFSGKLQKKQQKEAEKQAKLAREESQRARRQRTISISLATAYGRGQDGIVSAMRKLTGKSSQTQKRRQRTLKDSIIVLPAQEGVGSNAINKDFMVERQETWL